MSRIKRPCVIEIDLGDGDMEFVNWDNALGIKVIDVEEQPPAAVEDVLLADRAQPIRAHVAITITSPNGGSIGIISTADVLDIKRSIRYQLRILR